MPPGTRASIGTELQIRSNSLGNCPGCRSSVLSEHVEQHDSSDGLRELQSAIGHRFTDSSLLKQALTHNSAGETNYQTLEFLGDAVLNLAVADILYRRGDCANEGELSSRRSRIVNNRHALCRISERFGLMEYAILGNSFQRSNTRAVRHLKADLIESVVGAMFLEAGYGRVLEFVSNHFQELIDESRTDVAKDSKSMLQEYAQAQGCGLPEYQVVDMQGADHEPVFTINCVVNGLSQPVQAKGSTIKEAEQEAAALAYASLRNVR